MTDSPSQPEPHTDSHPDFDSSEASDDRGALLSRLQVIEDQPLMQRAPAYVQLHDELRAALEGADTSA